MRHKKLSILFHSTCARLSALKSQHDSQIFFKLCYHLLFLDTGFKNILLYKNARPKFFFKFKLINPPYAVNFFYFNIARRHFQVFFYEPHIIRILIPNSSKFILNLNQYKIFPSQNAQIMLISMNFIHESEISKNFQITC